MIDGAGLPRANHGATRQEPAMERGNTSVFDETSDLQREIDRLRADLRQLRGDISALGGDGARAARVGIAEALRAAGSQGRNALDGAEKQITSHPFLAVSAAFAIGMLLGYRVNGRN
ncbi:MAG: hypothetical protein ACO3QC_05590 [Phycisphaerales bacterium]